MNIAGSISLARCYAVRSPQAFQHSRFRAIELARIRHDRRDLSLLGNQKLLKLPRAHRGIDSQTRLIRNSTVDLVGDRVQTPDALPYRGMRAGA